MTIIETLREIPMFEVGSVVKVCKSTRNGPSRKQFEWPHYEVVSVKHVIARFGVVDTYGFVYDLRDKKTGEVRSGVRQNWLRKV